MRGRATDVAGAALIGASVTLGNLTTELERVAIADNNGWFYNEQLEACAYEAEIKEERKEES